MTSSFGTGEIKGRGSGEIAWLETVALLEGVGSGEIAWLETVALLEGGGSGEPETTLVLEGEAWTVGLRGSEVIVPTICESLSGPRGVTARTTRTIASMTESPSTRGRCFGLS